MKKLVFGIVSASLLLTAALPAQAAASDSAPISTEAPVLPATDAVAPILTTPVTAAAPGTPASNAFTYAEALRMATRDLSSERDIVENLALLEEQREDKEDELSKMNRDENGRQQSKLKDRITQKEGEIAALDEQVEMLRLEQSMYAQLGNEDGIAAAAIATLQSQRVILVGELDALNQQLAESKVTVDDRTLKENEIDSLDRDIETLRLNRSMIPTSSEMALISALSNIAGFEMDMELLEATVALETENVRRVTAKNTYGMASEADLRMAEQSLLQNRTNLDALRITLQTEKQTLNDLLQRPLSAESVVEYERTWDELPVSLDAYVSDRRINDPSIRIKQLIVDDAKMELDFRDEQNRKKGIKLDKDKVDPLKQEYERVFRELTDAQVAMETAIRNNYNQLEGILKQSESLLVDLEKANDLHRVAEARLKAGQVTQYDVDSAALAILQNEIAIEKNENSYWKLRFMFDYPFLLVGSV